MTAEETRSIHDRMQLALARVEICIARRDVQLGEARIADVATLMREMNKDHDPEVIEELTDKAVRRLRHRLYAAGSPR